jgi:regulator of protease activity HflC (stomatin/prohibitin superfamily)
MNIATVLRALSSISWVLALGVIVLAVMRSAQGRSFKAAAGLVIGAIVAALVLTTISAGLVFLQPEERGVVISAVAAKGYRDTVLQPGLRWVIPFAENVVIYPISRQTYTMSIAPTEGQRPGDDSVSSRTSDGQEVIIDASVIFAIDPNKVIDVHIAWQTRYDQDLVRPLARGIIRDEASQYRIDQIVSAKRIELIEGISKTMAEKFKQNGLVLADFVLRNIQFSPEYAASVEQKQIAEQLAQQAAFTVQQREQEAEQAREVARGQADAVEINAQGTANALVIQAEAEAEARLVKAEAEAQALEMIAAALRDNPEMLTFEYITRLAPGIRVMLLPSDNPFLLPLPEFEEEEIIIPTPVPEQ